MLVGRLIVCVVKCNQSSVLVIPAQGSALSRPTVRNEPMLSWLAHVTYGVIYHQAGKSRAIGHRRNQPFW
ncbi:hypothetical protein ACUOGZ_25440, partial [Escherichia coli]